MNLVGDFGGTAYKLAIIDREKIIAMMILEYPNSLSFSNKMEYILDKAKELISPSRFKFSEIVNVGLSFPGIVDSKNNRVLSINNKHDGILEFDFNGWAEYHGFKNIALENDARAALMGEIFFNTSLKHVNNCVGITLGTGIGTAAILNGNLVNGSKYQAAINMGHGIVSLNADRCNCGGSGCAESLASTWALKRDVGLKSFQELFNKFDSGDLEARSIIGEYAKVWAGCILNLIYAYDPEFVVIGGGVMHRSDVVLPKLKFHLKDYCWNGFKLPELKTSNLMEKAALYGMQSILQKF